MTRMVKENGVLTLMGAKEQRRRLTLLHAELEALIWEIECMLMHQKLAITFQTNFSKLVKMVSDSKGWPTFSTSLGVFTGLKSRFRFFSIVYILAHLIFYIASSYRLLVNSAIAVWLIKTFV